MKSYKARGIVLHSVKYGDSSVIIYMLTDVLGRQTYMVQGVRSGRGKGNKTALLQPMFAVEFVGLESAKMQMHRMKDVRSSIVLNSVPFDIRKSTISLFMAETLYRLIREVEPNSPLFDFVHGSIEALDTIRDGVANFHLWFLVRLSYFLGFYPANEYNAGSWFDIKNGSFTPIMPTHQLTFDKENSKILSSLMSCEVDGLVDIKLHRAQRSEFMTYMLTYFGFHFDSVNQIKSIQILKEVF